MAFYRTGDIVRAAREFMESEPDTAAVGDAVAG
jgi:hypothetical protein